MIKKSLTFAIALLTFGCAPKNDRDKALQALLDKNSIKEVVDQFSTLADKKDVAKQMELFTDSAIVESYRNGQLSSTLSGKKEIGSAFENFLGLFHTVYHLNGQQTININGNKASATSYCLVTLISINESGENQQITYGITYDDVFLNQGGKWLIHHRKSYFNWEKIN